MCKINTFLSTNAQLGVVGVGFSGGQVLLSSAGGGVLGLSAGKYGVLQLEGVHMSKGGSKMTWKGFDLL